MPVTITVSNENSLQKLKNFLGLKNESEAAEFAVEKVVREFEQNLSNKDLPANFFEDLFAEEILNDGESIKAIVKEREESKF